MSTTATAFTDEVVKRFDFLAVRQRSARRAFGGPDIEFGPDAGIVVTVTYRMSPMIFQLRLVEADLGTHYVDLVGLVDFGDHIVEQPISHESASTDRRMRRVVKQLAARCKATMS